MIRSSALLTVAAMALLVAGVTSASLRIIYLSIAVSILAAVTLGAGVLLRRRELFGHAGAAAAERDWAAAEQPSAEQHGDLAERMPKTTTGTGPGRWPGAIAAKGGPAPARHGGERPAGRAASRGGRPRSAGDEPAARKPAARAPAPREPARGTAGSRRDRDRDQAARAERETPGRGRDREQGREAGAWAGGGRPEPGRAAAARGSQDQEARGRDRAQAPAGERAQTVRLPPDPDDEAPWRRTVPRYVDDLAGPGPGGEQRGAARSRGSGEPPAGDGPASDEAPAQAAAGAPAQDTGSVWSAWTSVRAGRMEQEAAGTSRDRREPGGEPGATSPGDGAPGKDVREGTAAGRAPADRGPAEDRGTERDASGGEPETRVGAPAADTAGGGQDGAREAGGPPAAGGPDKGAEAEPGGTEAKGTEAVTTEPGAAIAPDQETEDAGRAVQRSGSGEAADGGPATAGAGESPGRPTDSDGPPHSPLDDQVTIVPGVARYHRRGCMLIRFLGDSDLETMTRREAEAAGSVPCKACRAAEPGPAA